MQNATLPRSLQPFLRSVALLLGLAIVSSHAVAGSATIGVALDTDNNATTGCVVASANGPIAGIEQVATTVVGTTTTGATVTRLERQLCTAGVLGAPSSYDPGGWNVGLGNGTGGSAVVESSIPLALLPPAATIRAVVISANATGGQDATSPFALTLLPAAAAGQPEVPIPLSPWLVPPLAILILAMAAWLRRRYPAETRLFVLFVVFAVSGLVWAATVLRDGNTGDWSGVAPAVTDATGDAPANADVVAVFVQQDGTNLYVRIDADIRTDTAGNQAPVVTAGPNQTITLPATATLTGSATDDGLPNPPGALTYAWTTVSGAGTVTFGNPSAAATTASFSAPGTYVLRLTASDSLLSTGANITIVVNPAVAGNQPPVVNAGANQTITLPSTASLSGSAIDDGLPNPPGALTYAWTKDSGPGTVTFANASSAATSATFSAAGPYVLRLTANDGALSASATVNITVNSSGGTNLPPTVNAGANQTIVLPAQATLAGTATDDGLPNPPGALTTTWSFVSGPSSGVVFGNPSALGTTATFAATGIYVLRLTADDGSASVSGTLQITVSDGAPQFDAIPDQTITLGTRLQLVLQASDGNRNDTLTYSLLTAPAGATLNPAPLLDWMPTAAQLGPHNFTVQVTDANGHVVTRSFKVTVVFTNHAPQLAPQNNQTVAIGNVFTRKLTAVDPDAHDVLTFALVSGPPGMTLSGADLTWPTLGRTPGDYAVTVRVTDASGATDQKSFTVTLQTSAAPVAVDDNYQTRVNQTLTVPAPGVLGNDLNPSNKPITAVKLSDPALGTLSAFNADGSFTFQAPATPPGTPLGFTEVWRNTFGGDGPRQFPLVGDVNGDGFPDLLMNHQQGPRAVNGRTGATLWNIDYTGYTDCRADFAWTNAPLLADIDDDGKLEYVGSLLSCARDAPNNNPGANGVDRIYALDTTTGRVKWQSERLSASMGDVLAPGTPPSTEDRFQHVIQTAQFVEPYVTRFSAGAPPTILLRKTMTTRDGRYTPITGPAKTPGCRALTGLAADDGKGCRATILMSGLNGTLQQILTAPNPSDQSHITQDPWREQAPFTVDLDGDGQLEIVSGSDVWKNVGGAWTLLWQSHYEPIQTLAADLDGDGKPEIVHLHAFDKSGGPLNASDSLFKFNGLIIRDALTGAELRRIRLPIYWTAWLTIADVDGDEAPDFVMNSNGRVMAIATDGRIKWSYDIPPGAAGLPADFRSGISNVQVYDLDGDGVPEVVTNSHTELLVFNGRTGAVKLVQPSAGRHGGQGAHHNVQLVDADNDGHVDVLAQYVSDTAKVDYLMMRGAPNNWLPGPKIHHQVNFKHGDIADNGRVLFNTAVPTSFRNPKQLGTIRDPRLAVGTVFTYAVNDGTGNSAPAEVFIEIKPTNQPPVITSTPPTALLQRFEPPTSRNLFTNYYQVTAFDPDPGDTLTYSLQSAPTAPAYVTMDANGRVRFEPTCGSFGNPCPWGWTFLRVRVTDSQGAFAEQSFLVNLTTTRATVPNVVGLLLPAAETAINAANLTPRVLNEVFDLAPAGTVIAQDPIAGAANIGIGDAVRMTVSKGPQPVLMPFLIGQQLAAANTLLAGMGLTSTVTSVFSNTIPAGEITAQSPAFGTPLIPQTAGPVLLTVSAGGPLPAPIAQIVLEPGPVTRLAGESIAYRAVAILSDGTSADVTLTAAWSSSATNVATINTIGVARAIAGGSSTISANVGGVKGSALLTVAAQALGDTTPPTAAITSPAAGATVTGPVTIVGTASDANFLRYELAIAPATDENYTVISEGTTAVTNGTLGTFDPTTLLNDLYTVRLRVFDRAENESVATSTVQVSGDRKVGLFTLTYQDLSIPAAGIPVVVTRTYDSRDKAKGDFGIGWRQGFNTLRLRTNRVLGTGWVRVVAGPVVTLTPTSEHKVSVTLADGRVEQFDMQVSPTANLGSLGFTNVTGFAPRPGTLGRLQALGNTSLLIVNAGQQDELLDDYSLDTYDPPRYRYTAVDGTQYEIGPRSGVTKVTDTNGNIVTFGPAGIVHSSGPSILFTRDTQNRIIAITDPSGNVQSYSYDANGDLVTHTDAVGGVSRYAYDRNHGLIEARDATGNRAIRNEYDASGRLIGIVDANGNRIAFSHNDAAQEEAITDRRGNVQRARYDAQGNVLAVEQGVTIEGTLVNAITTMTYDATGNETSRIDPDGRRINATYSGPLKLTHSVDPAGLNLTTSFTYNARHSMTSASDPGGRPFSVTFDGNGNPIGLSTPLAGAGTAQFDARGLAIRGVDAMGTTTALTRDAAGNVTREELSAGATILRRTDYTYDAAGNKLTETLHRTIGGVLTPLTTRFTYDAANRLTSVTDAMGGVRRIEYDAAGRVTAEIDQLGRRTTTAYDAVGRPVRTTFADGTFEDTGYDADGNVVSQTDQAGRTTTFAYDELNRNVRVTPPDGSFTQTIYSAAGQTAATIDARGNRTDFAYDAAGRATTTTLPAVPNGVIGTLVRPQVARTLNALGALVSQTDANGRTTSFQYDTAGRLIRISLADGTSFQQTFDVLGRRTSTTNEEGQTTTYTYDGLSRLTAVAGAAGDAAYAYDEAGNLVTETDALGRARRYRFDALNRMIERTHPGGELERFAYDAAGNLIATTDAKGKTRTFAYDAMNRATRKSLPGGVIVDYGYAPDGQFSTITDVRGVTRYAYDARGRLSSVTHPNGNVISYVRDASGNLSSLGSPAATLSYAYDALDRLTQVSAPEGSARHLYDLVGNAVRTTLANGVVTDYAYDSRNRATQLTHQTAANVVLQSFTNVYSPAGRRTRLTERDGSVENYAYDARGRLTSQTRTGINPLTISHAYDAVGNRTQSIRSGITTNFIYNSNDQLQSDGATTYAYDANGNLISATSGSASISYGYDAENRMATVTSGGTTAQYVHDPVGNLTEVQTAGGTTRLLVDSANNTGLSQVLEERDGANNLLARYSYGKELLAMSRASTPSFYLRDASGSMRGLVNATGAVTDTYQYDAYGGTVNAFGSTPNPYRYRGERLDTGSGLYQLRAREYQPETGRFTSRDPFAGRLDLPVSRHRYLYANADPINNSDPTGLLTLPELSIVQAIQSTLQNAKIVTTGAKVCSIFQKIEVITTTILVGGLATGIIASMLWATSDNMGRPLLPGKTAISAFGLNPAPLKDTSLKSIEFRYEPPSTAKFNFTVQSGRSTNISVGGKGLAVGISHKLHNHDFNVCGLNVGNLALKVSGKVAGDKGDVGVGVALSAELEAIKIFRLEYPLFEFNADSAKGTKTRILGINPKDPFGGGPPTNDGGGTLFGF